MTRLSIVLFFFQLCFTIDAQSPCKTSNITFIRQSQLDSFNILFPGCTEAENIFIYGQNINNVKSLINIHEAKGVSIRNTQIVSLDGLNNLIDGSLILAQNHTLKHLNDIKKLKTARILSISDCSKLESFEGLEVDSIVTLTLSDDILTKSLNGISSKNTQRLHILRWKYENLSGGYLPNVQDLLLSDIDNIDSISRFSQLEKLELEYASIKNLDELDKNFKLNYLSLFENRNLAHCGTPLMCNKLGDPNFKLLIGFNSNGCNTKEEIKANCISQTTDEDKLQNAINLTPNPTLGLLRIENLPQNTTASIFDLNGRTLMQLGPNSDDKLETNLTLLPPGMYLIQILDKTGIPIKYEKLIKQ